MAAGLALFAITLLVNLLAAQIVARSRSGASSDDPMTSVDTRSEHPPGAVGAAGQAAPPPDAGSPRTTLPERTERRQPPQRRPLTMIRLADVVSAMGAFFAAVATMGLLWQEVFPFSGIIGAVVVTWILFVVYFAVLISFDEDRMMVRDRVSAVILQSLAVLIVGALCWVIAYTFLRASRPWFTSTSTPRTGGFGGPLSPLTQSGALHAIVGTLIEVGIAMAIAIPFGVLTAVFMNEVPGRYATVIRTVVDAMTAMPDILAGLFIFATLISIWGAGR